MKRVIGSVIALLTAVVLAVSLWMSFAPPAHVAAMLLGIERERAGLELKEFSIPGFHIKYLEGGTGEPLVLLHGIAADKDHWTRVSRYLTPHFRVIAVDLPGFGESDKPVDRRYSGRDQVGYLHEIVSALGIASFHLGGNSMGGMISARYAVAYPDEVKTLWLLAPAGVGPLRTGELAKLKAGDHVPLFARSLPELEQALTFVTSRPPYIPSAVKRVLADRAAADYALHMKIFYEINDEWAAGPLVATVAGLQIPTRIVWGEEDRALPVADAEVLHAAMPNSSVLRLPGIGHLPMVEAPQTVGEDYLAFVRGS